MANRKATFAKRQRETDLKDRAKQKEDRRTQKRSEVRENKGPAIAWDEAVRAVTTDEKDLPPLGAANQARDGEDSDDAAAGDVDDSSAPAEPAAAGPELSTGSIKPGAPARPAALPAAAPAPAAPRRVS
jgi:hypothetical protein